MEFTKVEHWSKGLHGSHRKRQRTWSMLAAIALSTVVLGALPPAAAVAATPVLDELVGEASQMFYDVESNQIAVIMMVKKDIPANAAVSVSWKFVNQTRDSNAHGHTFSSGAAGVRMFTIEGPGRRVMPYKLVTELHLPMLNEERSQIYLSGPPAGSQGKVVTPTEAVATAVLMHVPGAALAFAPQSRSLSLAGKTILGWSIFSDVRSAITGWAGSCPRLAANQYYDNAYEYALDGDEAVLTFTTSVWHSLQDKQDGKSAECSFTFEGARFN